ncbi:hypothetical protein ACRRTK_019553 [Alexandromys fortis]
MAGGLLSSLHSLDGMFPTVYMELIELLGLPCDLQQITSDFQGPNWSDCPKRPPQAVLSPAGCRSKPKAGAQVSTSSHVPMCCGVRRALGLGEGSVGDFLEAKVFVAVTEERRGRLEHQGWSTLGKGAKVDMKPSSLVPAAHSEDRASQTPQRVREDGFCAPR